MFDFVSVQLVVFPLTLDLKAIRIAQGALPVHLVLPIIEKSFTLVARPIFEAHEADRVDFFILAPASTKPFTIRKAYYSRTMPIAFLPLSVKFVTIVISFFATAMPLAINPLTFVFVLDPAQVLLI